MPNSGELEKICDALLAVRLTLESHLTHNDSWRALKTAELGSIVAQHLGSDADEDSKKLHRKLLRTSATYRAYTRLIEAIRILSKASAEFAGSSVELSTNTETPIATQDTLKMDSKPRIKVKATSRALPEPPQNSKARAA